MDSQNKETAIQNEQQLESKQEIINDIIKIFSDNIISISDAEYILHETFKKICTQPVALLDENTKRIYRMRNMGKIN